MQRQIPDTLIGSDEEVPNLCKFRCTDEFGFKIIEHGEFWMAAVNTLNDPADCTTIFNMDVNNANKKDFIELCEKLMSKCKHRGWKKSERRKFCYQQFARLSQEENNQEFFMGNERDLNKHGILSFSGNYSSSLLWANYADESKGFCVEINSKKFKNFIKKHSIQSGRAINLVKVEYLEQKPNINFYSYMKNSKSDYAWLDYLKLKGSDWSYENEYRVIGYDQSATKLTIPREFFTKIILGQMISNDDKNKILECTKDLEIEILQANQPHHSYELEFNSIR